MKATLLKKLGLENTATVLTDERSSRIAGGQSEDDFRFSLNLPFEGQMTSYAITHTQDNTYKKRVSQEDSFL